MLPNHCSKPRKLQFECLDARVLFAANGQAFDIDIGANGAVWAIGTDPVGGAGDYGIYEWKDPTWINAGGGGVGIAVAPDGTPWIVNSNHDIYRRVGNTWQQLPGKANDISIGANGLAWAIGTDPVGVGNDHGVYHWNGSTWINAGGGAATIAVGHDGAPWIVNSVHDIYHWIGNGWQQVPGAAFDLAIGANGAVWAIGTDVVGNSGDHGIYEWNGTTWINAGGGGVGIAVAPDGTPWIVNSNHDIYRRVGNNWKLLSTFDIDLRFANPLNTVFQNPADERAVVAAFAQAEQRWERVVVGDLADVGSVDDLSINVMFAELPGDIAGEGRWNRRRAGSAGLPWFGSFTLDTSFVLGSIASVGGPQQIADVIAHEIGHVLGIGSLWNDFGLLVEAGTADPRYIGPNAVAQYQSMFSTSATSIPVENTGATASRDSHWRESIFDTEIMTSVAEWVPMSISRLTIGSLADLGYSVNYDAAEAYTLPPAPPPIAIGLFGDLDGDGRVSPSDLSILQRNWGAIPAQYQQGDLNGDGVVGRGDAAMLVSRLGAPAAPRASSSIAAEAVDTWLGRSSRSLITKVSRSANRGELRVSALDSSAVDNAVRLYARAPRQKSVVV
jgi:hypothetical protein